MDAAVSVLAELLRLIEKIPGTFWGVVTGSLIALGGIILTNRANDRRLQAQLSHDRALKNRERELSLRKDVYLAAAEAISAGLNTIGRLANLDIPHEKLTEEYLEKAPAIAKVHVIAKEETARAVAHLVGELGAAYVRLIAKRLPLVAQKGRITILTEQIGRFAKERDHMLELMRQFNLEGATDRGRWDVIQRTFEFEQKRVTEAMQQSDALAADLFPKLFEFTRECAAEGIKLGRLLVPALVAVRTELELPIDEATYIQVFEEGFRKQEASLMEALQQMQPFIAAQFGHAGDAPQAAHS